MTIAQELKFRGYRSTVDTSDELWQASSIRGIERSDLCIPRINPRYTRYMCVRLTRGKSTYIFLSFCVFRSAGVLRRCPFIMYLGIHGAKFAHTNPRCSTPRTLDTSVRRQANCCADPAQSEVQTDWALFRGTKRPRYRRTTVFLALLKFNYN